MTRGLLCQAVSAMALAFSTFAPAQSEAMEAGQRARSHHRWHAVHHRRIVLLPERQVVESVRPPYSGNYIINGTWFTAKTESCSRWVAGERVKLLAGDWHGACVDAVFYNVRRRQTCELSCR